MTAITHNQSVLLANLTSEQNLIWIVVSSILVAIVLRGIFPGNDNSNSLYDSDEIEGKKIGDKIIININNGQKRGNSLNLIFSLLIIGAGALLATGREELLFDILKYVAIVVQRALEYFLQ